MSSMPFRMAGRAASNSTSSLLVHSERTEKPPPLDSRHKVSLKPRLQARHIVEDEQVGVGGRDEEFAIVARQGAQRRGVGIDQRAQDLRHGRLGGALLAGEGEHRIRSVVEKRGQRPGDDQDEIAIGADIEERPEIVDRPAALGDRQREHARRPAKPHRRRVDDAPAGGADLDRAPPGVAKIEVELAVETGDAGMNLTLVGVVMGFGLDHVERRRHGFRARSAIGLVEESPRQPAVEAPRTNEPRLAMTLDVEIGVAGQVRRMKQVGGLGEPEQDVGLRLRPRVRDAASALFGERVVERGDAAAGALEPGPQGLEGGAIGLLQFGERRQDLGSEGRSWIGRRLLDEIGERIDGVDNVLDVRLDAIRGVLTHHGLPSLLRRMSLASQPMTGEIEIATARPSAVQRRFAACAAARPCPLAS